MPVFLSLSLSLSLSLRLSPLSFSLSLSFVRNLPSKPPCVCVCVCVFCRAPKPSMPNATLHGMPKSATTVSSLSLRTEHVVYQAFGGSTRGRNTTWSASRRKLALGELVVARHVLLSVLLLPLAFCCCLLFLFSLVHFRSFWTRCPPDVAAGHKGGVRLSRSNGVDGADGVEIVWMMRTIVFPRRGLCCVPLTAHYQPTNGLLVFGWCAQQVCALF